MDYHKKYWYVVLKDREGRVEQRGTVNNTKKEFHQLLKPYQEDKAVLEATRNCGLIYDCLEEILDDVILAHPLEVTAISEARIKTDKISADILCELLCSNLLPEAYVANKENRPSKNTLRQRIFIVRVQTMVKNGIYTILDRHPEMLSLAPDVSDLFGALGMRWLRQAVPPSQYNRLLSSEPELLGIPKRKISESNGIVKELAKGGKRVKLLRSIPRLGPFISVLVANEINDISRFRDEKKLCAYAGLVPSTYASGGKVFHGSITRTVNKWLRCAFIAAVQQAISCDTDLFAYYQQLKLKKGANAAKVATASRLLAIVYRVLKQERLCEIRTRRAIRRLAPATLITS